MIYNAEFQLRNLNDDKMLLFLAGSIDLELPGNWRKSVTSALEDYFNFFDPTTLKYNSMKDAEWEEHIKWELEAMKSSDLVLINFLENSASPISLVELGLNTMNNKLIVVCPDNFYKRKYIQVLCEYYSTPIFSALNTALAYIVEKFDLSEIVPPTSPPQSQ